MEPAAARAAERGCHTHGEVAEQPASAYSLARIIFASLYPPDSEGRLWPSDCARSMSFGVAAAERRR
jgi:hypothetical protein